MIEVSRPGAVRTMISWRNVQQSSDRIARIILNVTVCRVFLRSILSIVYRPPGIITDCHVKYRVRIDRLEMCHFAGLSPSR
jgi:hypothetical protein